MNDRAVWHTLGAPVDNDPPLLRTGRDWVVAGKGKCLTGEGALKLGLGKWLGLCQTKRALHAEATELRVVPCLFSPWKIQPCRQAWPSPCAGPEPVVTYPLCAGLGGGSS